MDALIFDIAWRSLRNWLYIPEGAAVPMRAEVLAGYAEPGRAYHTLGHALRVLWDAKRFAHRFGAEDYGAVMLAALLHDVVYDTRRSDNEALSAEFAERWGGTLRLDPETVRRASAMIRATQTHHPDGQPDAALVLDADLAVLASAPDNYEVYRKAIRREYAWVPEADWVSGRTRVLTAFLGRERIYHLPLPDDGRDAAARANIERELLSLRGRPT